MINKVIQVTECALGNYTLNIYNAKRYGIFCNDDIDLEFLSLLLFAAKSTCVEDKCNIENTIAKLTKKCKDCRPVRYKTPNIVFNTDYTDWYNSQEYLDCLQEQLIDQGWIEPMIDICTSLNVEVDIDPLCTGVSIQLSLERVDCLNITSIDIEKACTTFIQNINMDNTNIIASVPKTRFVLRVNSVLVNTQDLTLVFNLKHSTYSDYSLSYTNSLNQLITIPAVKDESNNIVLDAINTFEWYNGANDNIITINGLINNEIAESSYIYTKKIVNHNIQSLPYIYNFDNNYVKECGLVTGCDYYSNIGDYMVTDSNLTIANFMQSGIVYVFNSFHNYFTNYLYWFDLFYLQEHP